MQDLFFCLSRRSEQKRTEEIAFSAFCDIVSLMIITYLVFILVFLWLFMVWPGRGRPERMRDFETVYIAHRGFHDNKGPAPENSLASFRLAAEKGYGVELDVHETSDEALVVVHDSCLKRVAGLDCDVEDLSFAEVSRLHLFGTNETIPRLGDALETIGGRVPVVLEIKIRIKDRKNISRICEAVAFYLDSYQGRLCIESFDPGVLRWFRKNRPQMLRGQLSDRFTGLKSKKASFGSFFLSSCCLNFLTKPDFIAYNCKCTSLIRFRILRDLYHATTAGWTIRSQEELDRAKPDFDLFIFEGFEPAQKAEKAPQRAADVLREKKKMESYIRKHLIVSGMVQAVGFRYRATYIAQDLGVTGWVRNMDDGRVEMEIQGPRERLELMMKNLGEQRFIEIDNIDEEIIPVDPHEYEFKVRY